MSNISFPLGLFGPAPSQPRQLQFWEHQKSKVLLVLWETHKAALQELEYVQDSQSAIGCHACEQVGKAYCGCVCDACDSKYCDGNCTGEALYI
jgi:hypothetical protein